MRTRIAVTLIAAALAAAACNGGTGPIMSSPPPPAPTTEAPGPVAASVAGTYECLQPGATVPDSIEMDADGDLYITPGGPPYGHEGSLPIGTGAWVADPGGGLFNPGTNEAHPFGVTENGLAFDDGTECDKVSDATLIGIYECHPGGADDPSTTTIEVAVDGTVTVTPQDGDPDQGTWSLDGTSMTFTIEGQQPDTFEVQDRTLHDCEKVA